MIRIIADSTSEFSVKQAKEYNIDIVPLSVVFEEKTYLDWVELEAVKFYELLETKDYPTTSQPSPSQFYDMFKKYSDDEIIFIGISGDLSGTVQSARIAAADFKNRIEIIDGRQAAICTRLLVKKAIQLRDEGKDIDTIVNTVKGLIEKVTLIAGFDTLEYLVKGGRLSKASGMAGNILKIKPIIGIEEGKIVQLGKSRGTKAMIENCIDKANTLGINTDEEIIVGYTKDIDNALKLKEGLEAKGYTISEVVEIGAVIGVHAGPGACAMAFVRK